MKQLLLPTILITMLFGQQGFAQVTAGQDPVVRMLNHYYGLKDALAAGNTVNAADNAELLIRTLNSIDYKVIPEGAINVLLKDATLISETGDLQQQRTRFANLSDNLIAIARVVRLSSGPLYLVHCPATKNSWLSSDRTIKNPYGNEKPGCGDIVETIQ